MRSYYSHLQATKSIGEEAALAQKPTFRSSAIFPVLHNAHCSSRVIFMGYWLLKRQITEIGLLYTLRGGNGDIIVRKYLLVDSAKAFSISLNEFEEVRATENFMGSLELEIFSTRDLVFPYPAFVLVYYGENFSTAVHTVGRIYNDIEDLSKNEEYKVSESGFDIYGSKDLSPFVAFTNGPIPNNKPEVTYVVNNASGKTFSGVFCIPPLRPFETVFLRLKEHIDLSAMLANEPGMIRFAHNFEGFFPRFCVGNFDEKNHTISVTHSYYDSSELKDEKSFWNRKDELFNDSAVSIPLYLLEGKFTRLIVYPIFSPSDFKISFAFYDDKGNLLKYLSDYKSIRSSDNRYEQIDFGKIASLEQIDIALAKSVNIICNWDDKTRIPTRIKFALNVGTIGSEDTLPCNICFSPQLGNPNILKKNGTFRWAPFINIGTSEITLANSSSLKEHDRAANLKMSFHREDDDQTITRALSLAPNGSVVFSLETDKELSTFFNGKSGWIAIQSDSPFLNGYYFDFSDSGMVGADHLF